MRIVVKGERLEAGSGGAILALGQGALLKSSGSRRPRAPLGNAQGGYTLMSIRKYFVIVSFLVNFNLVSGTAGWKIERMGRECSGP